MVGNIGLEVGVMVMFQVYSGMMLKCIYVGFIFSSWFYLLVEDMVDGLFQDVCFVLCSVCDGINFWQQYDIMIECYGFGFWFGEELGGVFV